MQSRLDHVVADVKDLGSFLSGKFLVAVPAQESSASGINVALNRQAELLK